VRAWEDSKDGGYPLLRSSVELNGLAFCPKDVWEPSGQGETLQHFAYNEQSA